MTLILIKHAVKDYPTWKTEFDAFSDVRKSFGEQSYRIWHPETDQNNLTLLFEWDSTDNARRFLKSPQLKEAMQKAGVAGEPDIQFLHETASGKL